MGEVNIYVYEPSAASVKVAKKVRDWGTSKVRLWVSCDDVKNCEASVRRVIEHWRDRKFVDQNVQVDNSIQYYEWHMSSVQVEVIASDGLKALIQRYMKQKMEFAVLGDSAKCKGRMTCFVDAPQLMDLPDAWQKFQWLTSYDEVLRFCREQGVFDFDLTDTHYFSPTGKIIQGAQVYKELSTGNLVYLDNLHKTHYEVFSLTGKHLGEMSMNGILDPSMADTGKHLRM